MDRLDDPCVAVGRVEEDGERDPRVEFWKVSVLRAQTWLALGRKRGVDETSRQTYQELTDHPEIPRSDPKNTQRFAMLAYQTALGDLASRRDFSVGVLISRLLREG